MRIGASLLSAILLASGAHAAPSCSIPASLPAVHAEQATASEPSRSLPIGGYTLSLIWQPEHCRAGRDDFDCKAGAGHDGFVLHGLWPDGKGPKWPQYCAAAQPLPDAILRAHYCATPSPQLAQHEWTKHGTCMAGYSPDRYFTLSRRLFDQVHAPDLKALGRRPLTARTVQRAVAAANPGMRPEMLRLNVDKKGWLEEVWVCLSPTFRWQRCPAHAGGAKPNAPVRIWRGGA